MSSYRIDDKDPAVVYSKPVSGHHWSHEFGDVSLTKTRNASAQLTFTGSSIAVYGTVSDGGTSKVPPLSSYRVDGQKPFMFVGVPSGSVQKNVLFYQSGPLSSGQHTITVTNEREGGWLWLDYFEITPPEEVEAEIATAIQPGGSKTITIDVGGQASIVTVTPKQSATPSSPSQSGVAVSNDSRSSPGVSIGTILGAVFGSLFILLLLTLLLLCKVRPRFLQHILLLSSKHPKQSESSEYIMSSKFSGPSRTSNSVIITPYNLTSPLLPSPETSPNDQSSVRPETERRNEALGHWPRKGQTAYDYYNATRGLEAGSSQSGSSGRGPGSPCLKTRPTRNLAPNAFGTVATPSTGSSKATSQTSSPPVSSAIVVAARHESSSSTHNYGESSANWPMAGSSPVANQPHAVPPHSQQGSTYARALHGLGNGTVLTYSTTYHYSEHPPAYDSIEREL